MLMEQLEYNLLFRWFVGLSANEPIWHPTVFTKNRDRLLEGAVAEEFFSLLVGQARGKKLPSDEHFTVDGTLIEAWAGQKSFQRKDRDDDPLNPSPPDRSSNPTINWHREKRTNETHRSLTDPMARLYKKTSGSEARLGYLGHVLTENRNGLVVDVRLTQASGTAERDAAAAMISGKAPWRRVTLGADRGYDTRGFVEAMRELAVTQHVAQNDTNRRSAIDERTTRHDGYAVSQRKRKRVEEVFGWIKTIALQRKTRFRGWNGLAGCSRWRRRHTTWFGCATFRQQPHRAKCVRVTKNRSLSPRTPPRRTHSLRRVVPPKPLMPQPNVALPRFSAAC